MMIQKVKPVNLYLTLILFVVLVLSIPLRYSEIKIQKSEGILKGVIIKDRKGLYGKVDKGSLLISKKMSVYKVADTEIIEGEKYVFFNATKTKLLSEPSDFFHLGIWLKQVGMYLTITLLFFYSIHSKISYQKVLLLVGGVFVLYPIFNAPMNAFDEGAHFNIIDTLVNNCRFPKPSENHETVQPPFYYLLSAGLTKFMMYVNDFDTHFLITRLLSFVYIILGLFLITKTVSDNKEKLFIALLGGVMLSSSLVANTLLSINNDCLLFLLNASLLYCVVKFNQDLHYSVAQQIVLGLLLGVLFLTKLTGVAMMGAFGFILLVRKRILSNYILLSVFGLCALSWFFYNYYEHEKFTLIKEHYDTVVPIVNKGKQKFTIFDVNYFFFAIFAWGWFDSSSKMGFHPSVADLFNKVANFLLYYTLAFFTYKITFKRKKLSLAVEVALLSAVTLASFLIYISSTTPLLPVRDPRYYHFLAPWLI